jgi:hypothetical protein
LAATAALTFERLAFEGLAFKGLTFEDEDLPTVLLPKQNRRRERCCGAESRPWEDSNKRTEGVGENRET